MTFVLILQICVGFACSYPFLILSPFFYHELTPEILNFKEGIALGEVDIFIDGGKIRNKVRSIVEKRVSQERDVQSPFHRGKLDPYVALIRQDIIPAIS